MNTHIEGFTFIIEKAHVFIEAKTLHHTGGVNGLGLISIEAPRLRSVAACNDYGQTLLEFKKMGILSPSAGDLRELRARQTYECRFWSHETRHWTETLLRPRYECDPRSATSSDSVMLVEAVEDRPSFQSVPLNEQLILSLCAKTSNPEKDVIYVQEGHSAALYKADDYEMAFDEILRLRRDGLIATAFPQKGLP